MWTLRSNKYSSSLYKWIEYKEFRKQHRLENQILNEKIVKKNNTRLQNLKNSFKANQKRLKIFGIFAVVFSLGFIYDWYLTHRHKVKRLQKNIKQLIFGTARVYSKTVAEVDKRFVYFKNPEEKQIGECYRIIDRKCPKGIQSVAEQLCSSLGIQMPKNFNISSFFDSLRKSNTSIQQHRDNMRLFSMSNQIIPSS